ncbi:MAG: hydroxyacylglutathione hydrolase [Alphaproteobacteria bacterium]
MTNLDILQIPVLGDNYVYLLHDEATAETACVDPAVAGPVLDALAENGWRLSHILNTHHHDDHTAGNLELKQATGCVVVGSGGDASRIPGIDVQVADGDRVSIGGHTATVLDVPGHTRAHIAYWFEDSNALFSGDTLFSLGCGRLFEGTAEQMWNSLLKFRALPDDTKVYCAHEYTDSNADFALSIDPDNAALNKRAEEVIQLRQSGRPTVPSVLGEEKAANPFLRADAADLLNAAGLTGMDAVTAFAEIRRRKDSF